MDDAKDFREIAKIMRDAADAADKLAALIESENSTEQEIEDATKDFVWQMMKMQTK